MVTLQNASQSSRKLTAARPPPTCIRGLKGGGVPEGGGGALGELGDLGLRVNLATYLCISPSKSPGLSFPIGTTREQSLQFFSSPELEDRTAACWELLVKNRLQDPEAWWSPVPAFIAE
jgi:hypothetical protein